MAAYWPVDPTTATPPPITSTVSSTLPPPGSGTDFAQGGSSYEARLPQGTWVWLLLVIPLLIGVVAVLVWMRLRRRPESFQEHPANVEEQADKYGAYYVVKPKPPDEQARRRPFVFIDVHELPQLRPLGLELQETKVIRVHGPGKRWGWQVGDVIVQIGGVPVTTFEELWQRIQIERDRVPVRFVVERTGAEGVNVDLEELASQKRAAANKDSKVAPEPVGAANEVTQFKPTATTNAWFQHEGARSPSAASGLPSALAGWESFVGAPDTDEALELPQPTRVRALGEGGRSLTSTAFMREFPLTPAAKQAQEAKRMKDTCANDVRWVRDAWGRSVLKVGG